MKIKHTIAFLFICGGAYAQININGNATLYINSGAVVVMTGYVTNSGYITGAGKAVLGGSSQQAINGIGNINNLTLNNAAGAVISNSVGVMQNIYGTLTISNGNLATGGNLTLKSDSNGTASVGGSAGTISGNAIVERYISGIGRKWRFLSGKTIGSVEAIRNAWQEAGASVSNLGTWLTIPGGGNGYDGSSNNPSLLKFVPSIPSWTGVTATNSGSITDEQGYMLFVRGDRTDLPSNSSNHPTVLRMIGTLRQGTQPAITIPLSNPGYTIVGNPFASPIDFENFHTTQHLQQDFYIWDAGYAGVWGVGGFRLVSRDGGGNYSVTPSSGINDQSSMRYINSGQAFFVKATGADASLTLDETSKSANTPVVPPSPGGPSDQQLLINLLVVNAGNVPSLADGIRLRFDASYSATTSDDAEKIVNFGENLSSFRDQKQLALERRPLILTNDSIFLRVTGTGIKNYRFEFFTEDFMQPGVTAFLQDSFLGTTTAIDLSGSISNIDFSVTGDAASSASDRFRIVFAPAVPLPLSFTSIKAFQTTGPNGQGTDIAVEWKVANQVNIQKYEVERSGDGINFRKMNTQQAIGSNGSDATYNWLDVDPIVGDVLHPADNFYRVRSIGVGEEIKYSPVADVRVARQGSTITVSPNPVTGKIISVRFENMAGGNYALKLINSIGQVLMTELLIHTGGSETQTMRLGDILPGNYYLEIIHPGNNKTVVPLTITN